MAPANCLGAAAADPVPRHHRRQCPPRRSRRTCRARPRALGLAGASAFVYRLPDGLETVVGDGGRPLSAGECQRIALARAFLRDAPLAILDEPTANLDAESAEIVAGAVERLSEQRTVLLIAHAPELAALADDVVELRAGQIVKPVVEAV